MSRAVARFREATRSDSDSQAYNQKHPHAPAGSPTGGQFSKGSGGGQKAEDWRSVLPGDAPKMAAKPSGPAAKPVLPPPTTTRTMKPGDSGDDVRNLQYAMGLLGFKVPQDGVFSHAMADAVMQAQQRLGIKPNGHASASLLRKMQDAVRLSPCVKESTAAARIRRILERFDPTQPRDTHGRWSLIGALASALRSGGHEDAAAHLEEMQGRRMAPTGTMHARRGSRAHIGLTERPARVDDRVMDVGTPGRRGTVTRVLPDGDLRVDFDDGSTEVRPPMTVAASVGEPRHYTPAQVRPNYPANDAERAADRARYAGSPRVARGDAPAPTAEDRFRQKVRDDLLAGRVSSADAADALRRMPERSGIGPTAPSLTVGNTPEKQAIYARVLAETGSTADAWLAAATSDKLDAGSSDALPADRPPLSPRQLNLLLKAHGAGGSAGVEDVRNDPEIRDLADRGLIKIYPLKGQIQLTGAGRKEFAQPKAPAKKAVPGAGVDATLGDGLDLGEDRQLLEDARAKLAAGKSRPAVAKELEGIARRLRDSAAIRYGGWGRTDEDPDFTAERERSRSALVARAERLESLAEQVRAHRAPGKAAARVARAKAAPKASFDAADVRTRLDSAESPKQAREILSKLTTAQLAEVSPTGAAAGRTKAEKIDRIANLHQGFRSFDAFRDMDASAPAPEVVAGVVPGRAAAKVAKAKAGADVEGVAAAMRGGGSEREMVTVLSRDQRLTSARLKDLADQLGIDVPPNMNAKSSLQMHIALAASRKFGAGDGGLVGRAPEPPARKDFSGLANDIRHGGTPANLEDMMTGLNATELRSLADELNVALPTPAKSAAARRRYIAQTVWEHHRRTTGGL